MNDLLYDYKKETIETHTFKINGGGEYDIKEHGTVAIIFVNGKFDRVNYPFSGTHSRNGWRILQEINEKIEQLEENVELA